MDKENLEQLKEKLEFLREDAKDRECIRKAEKVLNDLKLDMSVRRNNDQSGSGLGGNSAELFFLMTHRVKFLASSDDKVHFTRGADLNEIHLASPLKFSLRQARLDFTDLYNSHPDKKDITEEQLMNLSFLKDLNSPHIEVKLLIHAIEEISILQKWLDSKIEYRKQMREFFQKEIDDLRIQFLKDMKLPTDYFAQLKAQRASWSKDEKDVYAGDPMGSMFSNHPVWGAKKDTVNKRISEVEDRLLSAEDNFKLKFLGSFPAHIALFVMRTIIQIERMVALNLDENENCASWLAKINKRVDAPEDEEKKI